MQLKRHKNTFLYKNIFPLKYTYLPYSEYAHTKDLFYDHYLYSLANTITSFILKVFESGQKTKKNIPMFNARK